MDHLLIDGPSDADATVVLAHGAGAGMEHAFLHAVAEGLADRGLCVVRFEFPYMQARRAGRCPGPDRLPVLQDAYRAVVRAQSAPIVLAGKSMGGRVATTIADELGVLAVVVFGYPFHPPKQPTKLRTAHLEGLQTPTLILQGERDPFGTPAEVAGYELSPSIELCWLEDGDHSLQPRKRSGFTEQGHLATAIDRAFAFVQAQLA